MEACKHCVYWDPCEDDPHRGVCTNPERDDTVCTYFYGTHKEDDFCTRFEEREAESDSHGET